MEAYKLGSHTVWVANSGNVTDEVWVDKKKKHTPPPPHQNYKVT
jgi:hypothetical protein